MKKCVVLMVLLLIGISLRAQEEQLVLPIGHSDGIMDASYSVNGKYVLTASMDHTARIWDAYNGKLLSVLIGHTDYVNSIQSTNDSKLAITASNDNTIKVWTLPQGILTYNFSCENCFNGVIASDDKCKMLAIATGNGKAKIFNLKNGLLVKELQCHNKRLRKILFSPDGSTLLTAAYDEKIIKAINIENGNTLFEINYTDWEPDFDFLSNATEIIVKGEQGKIYDAANGLFLKIQKNYQAHEETIEVWSPDKKTYLYFGVPNANAFLNYVSIHDATTTRELRRLSSLVPKISSIQLSPDKNFLASVHDDKSARIWDLANGDLVSVLHENSLWRPELWGGTSVFSSDGKKLITVFYDSCTAIIWDINSKKLVYNSQGAEHEFPQNFDLHFTNCAFCEDSSKLLISNWGCVSVIDARNYKLMFQRSEVDILSAEWTDHGKKIVIKFIGIEPEIWSAENWTLLHRFDFEMKDEDGYIENFKVCKNGKKGISLSSSGKVGLWDINTWKLIYANPENTKLSYVDYDETCNYIVSVNMSNIIKIIDPETGNYVQTFAGHNGSVYYVDFNNDGSEMMSFSEEAKEVIHWDINSGKIINRICPSEKPYCFFCFNDKYFAHNSLEIICYEKKINEIKFRMAAIEENGYVCLLKNGIYRCSREALKYLSWKKDNVLYGFDQWDLIYNRPDEVMKTLGSSDTELMNAFYKAYLKRSNKMKLDASVYKNYYKMPEASILNADSLQGIVNQPDVCLKLRVVEKNQQENIVKIMVTVNNSSLADPDNMLKFDGPAKDFVIKIPVHLSEGQNIIEVSCLNSYGVSSLKNRIMIDYLPENPQPFNKHLVAISLSEYQNDKYNLKYAVKDGSDMAKLFATKDFSIDTLFNQKATRENILAVKQKLMQTKVDDEVILYISGHGLLDKNYDFYFATYNMDFEDPAKNGILYDDLEGLLDGIPARKKLLLMDACHSGEVDKEDIQTADSLLANNKVKGDLKVYSYKGTIIEGEEGSGIGLQNSFELMQELFANLSRGSGATVISAASGTGYALESPEWNNGVFTYCIINGLKNLAADTNKDNLVTVSELKEYISKEVVRLTNGAQKPTSRRESLEFDWRVW